VCIQSVRPATRRPTFLPSIKLTPPRPGWREKDARRGVLAAYLNALADLAGPKRALPALRDGARLRTYSAAIRHAVSRRPGVHNLLFVCMPAASSPEDLCMGASDACASAAMS